MQLEFNHIHYRCSDFETVRAFYCDVLGGENLGFVRLAGREHLHIRLGGQSLFFAPNPAEKAREAVSVSERMGAYHIAYMVKNHDEAVAYFKSRGATFVSEGLRPSPSLKVAFIEAPDGMQVEIMEIS